MMTWLWANLGTILISLGLVLMVALIIRSMIRDKQKGKSSCGGNCGCCPMGGACHGHMAK
ncbi:MAG: FeoB-associated Cys-rich membrane protein [Lachnospiraceae bacterium]|nr:FeoB-associated Cys-rich membrane protein [Lachnospiraceae bacterium]